MPDQYGYLLGASVYFLLAIATSFYRSDLRKLVLRSGFLGGFAGLISEYWYYQDYWQPPTLRGQATISVEDFLAGFGAAVIATVFYRLVKNYRGQEKYSPKYSHLALFAIIILVTLIVFTSILGINSIFTSSVSFLAIASFVLYKRKDLWESALYSAAGITILSVLIYIPFSLLFPDYLDNYYLLQNTFWGKHLLFGLIPLTELIWVFSFGLLAGCLYDYVFGLELVPRNSDTNSAKS